MISRVRIKDHWNEQRLFSHRTLAATIVVALLSLVLIARLLYLQIVRHSYYAALSQSNRVRVEPLPANRGLIFDRNGVVLAENEPAFQLELTRDEVPDLDATLQRLVHLGLLDADQLDETRQIILSHPSFDPVAVRLQLTDAEIARFASRRYEFPGVDIATRETRHYPFGSLTAHAVGYVGAISVQDLHHINAAAYEGTTLIGKSGIEASYESKLHGHNGYRTILVNAAGRPVQGSFGPQLPSQPPTPGDNLTLSIDLAAQEAAVSGLGHRDGAVVAIDPNNGDVLALASTPGFDPDAFARGLSRRQYAALIDDPNKPLLDRAIAAELPSGSTIKPTLALGALRDGAVDPAHYIYDPGFFRLPHSAHRFRESEGYGLGWVDMVTAIAKSCDVYFYGLAHTLGIERIDSILSDFGVGRRTGIDIPGEMPGLLPSPAWKRRAFRQPQDQEWYPGDTVVMGIGQGYLLVTPLQLAHIAATLAERGRSFRPRLVIGIRDPNGSYHPVAPVPLPPVTGISAADWNVVVKGMVGAAQYGTAAAIGKNAPYTIAGKTGTAQVFDVPQNELVRDSTNHVARRLRDDAWFIAFAPVDHPLIAVAVLVEHSGFGADFAAPIARKVMDAYLLHDGHLRLEDGVNPSLARAGSGGH